MVYGYRQWIQFNCLKDVKQDLIVQVMNQIGYLVNDGVKDRKGKAQKSVLSKENLSFKIMKIVKKQSNLKIK